MDYRINTFFKIIWLRISCNGKNISNIKFFEVTSINHLFWLGKSFFACKKVAASLVLAPGFQKAKMRKLSYNASMIRFLKNHLEQFGARFRHDYYVIFIVKCKKKNKARL